MSVRDPLASPVVPAPASPTVTAVASIAALKALAGTDITGTVNVLSYYASAIPDGGGGEFTWNATDTRSNNGGTIIQPTAGGVGRWNRTASDITAKYFGAVGDGVTDDTAAIQAAIDATPRGGELKIVGSFRCLSYLSITKAMTISGSENRNANTPDNVSNSLIYFPGTIAQGFLCDNTSGNAPTVSFRSLTINGAGATTTTYGIKCVNGCSPVLEGVVIGAFVIDLHVTGAYYVKLSHTRLVSCNVGMSLDNCYNVVGTGLGITSDTSIAGSICVNMVNVCSLTLNGGSIESFRAAGIFLSGGSASAGGSIVNLNGVFFEGTVATPTGYCVQLSDYAAVNAIGCHVYMTGAIRWISTDGFSTVGARIFSRNNKFVWPTDTQTAVGYAWNPSDVGTDVDIGGDFWTTSAGANVSYIHATTIASLSGRDKIAYPMLHANAGHTALGASIATAKPRTGTSATDTITAADSAFIANRAGTITLTLESASAVPGRLLTVRTIQAQTVVSAASNVVPLAGGAAGTAILAATAGKWATIQSDGTNWQIMTSN